MRLGKRAGLPLLILLTVLVLVVAGFSAGCGGSTVEGSFAALHHGPGMDDVLLVLDGRIYSIPIEEGTPRPRLLYESPGWYPMMTAFIPLVKHEDDEMTLHTFRRQAIGADSLRPLVEIHSFTRQLPDGDLEHEISFPRDGEPPEMMHAALEVGIPTTPVMFRNQQLALEHDGTWYRLTTDSEFNRRSNTHRYTFRMEKIEDDSAELGVSIPGHDSLLVDERITIWHPDGWDAEERREVEQTVEDALSFLDEVFDPGYRLPWTITVDDREDQLLRYRVDGAPLSGYVPQARFAFAGPGPPPTRWLRHELTHALHIHALLERGMSLVGVPTWAVEGLAVCFEVLPDTLVHYDYPKLLRSQGMTLHRFNPVSFDPDNIRALLAKESPLRAFYPMGRYMVLYLVEEFGNDRMMEYMLAVRSHAGDEWDREDDVTREFFGMTQAEILRAALEEPVEVSERLLPDYVVSEWELLTDVSLSPVTPDVTPQGDRVAFMSGGEIMVMDLDSGEVQTVLGDGQHEFASMGTLSWFPCGERLMFMARQGTEQNLYAFTVADPGTIQEVVVSDSTDSGGVVSPCGEMVAFRSEKTGISELFLKELATGEITQLTDGSYPKHWPRWSPGGGRIAFESRCPGEDNVSLLGVIDLESGDIAYHDLHPWYRTWTMSRPEWLCDDEILVPVLADEVRTTISVNLVTGEEKLWGGMVQALQRVIPIPGSDDAYLARVWDIARPHEAEEFAGGWASAYRRLMRVAFEEYGPK